jgi:hypothetical protein
MSAATPEPVPDEDHSTGTAWRAPHAEPAVSVSAQATPCTIEEQVEHLATLAEAISGFRVGVALKTSTARNAA